MQKLTASQILEISARADFRDGNFDGDGAYHSALGEYVRAREEIRERAHGAAALAPEAVSKGATT